MSTLTKQFERKPCTLRGGEYKQAPALGASLASRERSEALKPSRGGDPGHEAVRDQNGRNQVLFWFSTIRLPLEDRLKHSSSGDLVTKFSEKRQTIWQSQKTFANNWCLLVVTNESTYDVRASLVDYAYSCDLAFHRSHVKHVIFTLMAIKLN